MLFSILKIQVKTASVQKELKEGHICPSSTQNWLSKHPVQDSFTNFIGSKAGPLKCQTFVRGLQTLLDCRWLCPLL